MSLSDSTTTLRVRPAYEGANIGPWIGFKHVNYIVEEAVLNHFRERGLPAHDLYERHAVGLDVVELDTRILHALRIDEVVAAHVTPLPGAEFRCRVVIEAERSGRPAKAVTSTAAAVLRRDHERAPEAALPHEVSPFVVDRISGPVRDMPPGANRFVWTSRVPYFYCHFTDRMQMSGCLRVMEEVVDLFLADRGISIRTMLDEAGWIPVVPHSRIRLLGEAAMEEELHTAFTVEDVFKDFTYTSRMDCHVVRDGRAVPIATGVITHGYAVIEKGPSMRLVNFDDRVLSALLGEAG
ncbi:hypothetical protein BBK82_30570 [Lentzea guizhouensis]|uniref:Thioesterase n=1 Tax=Lentzea guizhouensis TaxID=1586287 RepID=A0A1B2HPX4_9PSEU|nr:thioesterase family protein [Lentzea guizhouensis]ANZ39741.1 hypothetical protein BBK82_30570 [Lentzea guizhouensis]